MVATNGLSPLANPPLSLSLTNSTALPLLATPLPWKSLPTMLSSPNATGFGGTPVCTMRLPTVIAVNSLAPSSGWKVLPRTVTLRRFCNHSARYWLVNPANSLPSTRVGALGLPARRSKWDSELVSVAGSKLRAIGLALDPGVQ
ncbi:MAG: hypothetical protein BWZ07_03293 [Alphaproteobacteria bacterium ADurb.BinA280]|nr:MAG: hypothetical protein BWZ07_03293 [Alphaproteobacteria bacterium ADurb.BinA280]